MGENKKCSAGRVLNNTFFHADVNKLNNLQNPKINNLGDGKQWLYFDEHCTTDSTEPRWQRH